MKRCYLPSLSVVVLAGVLAMPSFAQKWEVYPYAGGSFTGDFRAHPDQIEKFSLVNPGMFGVRGGFFATETLQIEGNFGYMNQFKIRNGLDPTIRAFQYDGGVLYNFSRVSRFSPYVAGGVGAMTLSVSDSADVIDDGVAIYPVPVPPFSVGGPILATSRPFTVEDGDTFLSFTYGGEIKFERVWGPLGFRVDVRGRTMPNYYGDTVNAFEPTGGILLSWGER
jgi:hypothetical protein